MKQIAQALIAFCAAITFGMAAIGFGIGLLPLPALIVTLIGVVALIYGATEGLE